MPRKIESPTIKQAAGNKYKHLEEFIGRDNSDTADLSIARMKSPEGWEEPGQKPEFDEYTLVLRGMLRIETADEVYEVRENEAMIIEKGLWVKYSTPERGGAEYIAVCVPAFSPDIVHRDA